MGEVHVRVVVGEDRLGQIAEDWERCRRAIDLPRPGDRLDALVRQADASGHELRAVVATDGTGVVGILPFEVGRWRRPLQVRLPKATRTLASVPLTRALVRAEDVFAAPGDVVAPALLARLLEASEDVDVVALPAVRVGSGLDQALAGLHRRAGRRVRLADGAPKERLLIRLDEDLDGYLANQGGRRYRRDLRRDQRRAREQGQRIEVLTGPDDAQRFLEPAAVVWAQSWHGSRSNPLPTAGRALDEVRFHAAAGRFRGYLLLDGAEPAAFLWAWSDAGVLFDFRTAFAPRWRELSPGKLLLHQAVVDAHADGVRLVDFGYGDYPYKRRWANDRLATRSVLLVRPSVRPLAACLPPAGYRRVRTAAIHRLEASGLDDRVRRFSSRRLGR